MSPLEESDDKGMVTVDDEAGTTRTVDVARDEAEMSRILDEDEGRRAPSSLSRRRAQTWRMVELMELELGFSLLYDRKGPLSVVLVGGGGD